ncbi:MAG TPA: PqiC family protein [Rhodocyclaceae bacterium]|nr:PqiC family protein [Rhodocyclaceae bacterium]
MIVRYASVITWPAFAILSLAMLCACSSNSPAPHYYTLSTSTANTSDASSPLASAANYSVGVATATLPDAIDRPQLVVRINANRVDMLEDQRWADDLKREIPRVVAENLAQRLGSSRVAAYPQHAAENTDYTVLLDVQRFDSEPNEAATLDILWTLRRTSNVTPRTTHFIWREPVNGIGFDALVAAHSRALAKLSDQIAQAIRADAAHR